MFCEKAQEGKSFFWWSYINEISPNLITYLSKIGYKITKAEKDGKAAYEVRFSDNAAPISLFSKTTSDPSLPKKDAAYVIVCDIKTESDCANIKTEYTPFHLAFPKVTANDGDDKVEATVKNIAAEMLYVTNK